MARNVVVGAIAEIRLAHFGARVDSSLGHAVDRLHVDRLGAPDPRSAEIEQRNFEADFIPVGPRRAARTLALAREAGFEDVKKSRGPRQA